MDFAIPQALRTIFLRASEAGLKVDPYICSKSQSSIQNKNPIEGLQIHLPNGKATRSFLIKNDERLSQFSELPFEQIQFISGLEAIWSKSEDVLEAELKGDPIIYNPVFLIKRLKLVFQSLKEIAPNNTCTLLIPYLRKQVMVEFDASTQVFNMLSNHSGRRPKAVIRITGTGATCHDEARSALQQLTNTLLFQINREYNIHLCISSTIGLYSENRTSGFPSGIHILGS